jgi:serine/threonine-protein kinase
MHPDSLGWVGQASTDPLLGELIDGKYRVLARLGTGGMGVVYRVRHEKMDKHFALKLLPPQFGKEHEFHQRFVREARAASKIDHPHVVRVTDIGEVGDSLYYVMDLLKGAELRAVLDLAGRLSWKRLRPLALQILSAAGAAHAKGFIHRDLKPDNIFLVGGHDSDHAMVFDFGIAHALKTDLNGSSLTAVGSVMGSPRYMSPEQCIGAGIDARSDLYAIGIILYECLTGHVPFEHSRIYDTIHAQVHEDPPAFATVAKRLRVPDGLEEVVRKALRKDPDERFAHAGEFIEALEALDIEEPPATRQPDPTGARSPAPAAAFNLPSFLGGLALGAALVGLLWALC